jgi:hypothetical protein
MSKGERGKNPVKQFTILTERKKCANKISVSSEVFPTVFLFPANLLFDGKIEFIELDGLGDIIVHAAFKTFVAVIFHGMGC